jgi:hypothetical protein
MPDVRFIPRHDPERAEWLKKFAANLPKYAAQLNVTAEAMAQLATDAAVFDHLCRTRAAFDTYTKALTAWRNALRDGGQLSDFPQPPQLEPPPPGAVAGIFPRASQLARYVKLTTRNQPHIATNLGLIAPKRNLDLATVKPEIRVIATPGMQPFIKWKKGRLDGVHIHVDRGDGNFVWLTSDITPGFTDPSPLPPPGTAVVWRYKAIYFKGDAPVGQWSNIVSVTVTG